MSPNKVVGAHEKGFQSIQKFNFALGKMGKDSEKFPGRTRRHLNVFLKLITLKSTKLKQQADYHIKQKPVKLIQKIWKTTLCYLNWLKLKLTLSSFIQIFKPFILFSILYSQPKIRIFLVREVSHIKFLMRQCQHKGICYIIQFFSPGFLEDDI